MSEYRQWRLKGSLFLVMMPLIMGAMEQEEEMRIDGMNLIEASENGHKEIVDKLIEKGANVHAAAQYGWTALMGASSRGCKEIVDKLIEKGADIDAADKYGRTALIEASWSGHKEVVDKLIEQGANVHAATKAGWTALMRASWSGHKEVVDKLIERGADPYIKNDDGRNCLDVADDKELKDYIVAKHRAYTKKCVEHLVAFLQKGGTKNGRYCDWSGSDTEKKSGPFPKDIALHIAQIRYGVTEDEWSEMCRLENEEEK